MNKGCRWIIIFLITSEVTTYASCVDFNNDWRHSGQRNIFFLNPSHNEYGSPLPILLSNPNGRNRHSQFARSTMPPSLNRYTRNRTPAGRNAQGYASVTREIYAHPLKPVTRSEGPALIVTKSPTSFDIPLRKSIRVSNPNVNRPSIQTTGFISETAVVKMPFQRTTPSPKHTVFVDSNLQQTTAQTEADVTSFYDSWRPKRLPTVTPSYNSMTVERPVKPIPFTRFSDAMAAIKPNNQPDDRRGRPNLTLLKDTAKRNNGGSPAPKKVRINFATGNKENLSPPSSIDVQEIKLSNGNNKDQSADLLPTILTNTNQEVIGFRKANPSVSVNQNNRNVGDMKELLKIPTRVIIGVEYADSEADKEVINSNPEPSKHLQGKVVSGENNTNAAFEIKSQIQNRENKENSAREDITTGNSNSDGILSNSNPQSIVTDNQKYVINSRNLANHKEFRSQNSDSEDVQILNPGKFIDENPVISGSYVRYDEQISSMNAGTSNKDSMLNNFNNKPHSEVEISSNKKISTPSKTNKVDSINKKYPKPTASMAILLKDNIKETEAPFRENFPLVKTPFYGEIIHNPYDKDYSKDITEDRIYFPQIFPDSGGNFGAENSRNGSDSNTRGHTSVHVTKKNFVDKERLIEINPKETDKNRNNVDRSRLTYFNQPKAVTISDFSSFKSHPSTSPSLITVSSDNSDLHRSQDVILDPKRSKDKLNKTSTYILHRTPSLLPEDPGSNSPRKPNVRLTSGMLAGILIAALIFLGFLTGTMVFAFHQIRFGSTPKKGDRHKKRTTVYAPEYLDENFSGNTYIHNNIFLPNPQNLEDRLSPDIDTTFSVDSEETAQANDHYPSTSSNTRIKTATVLQRTHDEDGAE